MSVIRLTTTGSHQSLTDCFYPAFLNSNLALLRGTEAQDAIAWINRHVFDDALTRPNRAVNVTQALRDHIPTSPDWTGSVLNPLWDRTGQDEERASWVYGNLVCRVGIQRPETWWHYMQSVGYNRHSSTYVLSHI